MDDQEREVPVWGRSIPGELLERWPKDENGEPELPRFLCHRNSVNMEDVMLVSRMESYGIPCLKQYPNNGVFGKLILGISGTGTDIFVPSSQWEDARVLLQGSELYSEEELWS